MAKTAKKKKAASSSKKKKRDPFTTRKVKVEPTSKGDSLTPPEEVAEAIDKFRDCQEQARHFEGEATVYKDRIVHYAKGEYVKRLLGGTDKSFKLLGEETMVTYVVMDSSAGLTEEDAGAISERWGEEAADDLVTRDFASVRFDPKVLAANYDAVVEALQNLPEEVLTNLFKPMLMKASQNAAEKAKKYAQTPEELRELLQALKLKHYIR